VASVDDWKGAPLSEQVAVSLDDVVALPFSSGTTGLSKGVMLTHRNLVANIAQTLGAAELADDEVVIAVLPFFHIYGMQVMMNTALRAGATIVTMPRFDLPQFLQLHQDYRVTRSFVAPPIVVALAKHPIVDQYDLSSGSAVGGARHRGRSPAQLRGHTGIRHDRVVAGLAPHAAGPVQAGFGGCHRPQHGDDDRRPGDRTAGRPRRRRRGLGARPTGDEGLPRQR
jgi:acyl-CoA synthetase (AMP-forming)/AMP-acid ligase II